MSSRFARLTAADLLNLAVEEPAAPMHVGAVMFCQGDALGDPDGGLRLVWIRAVIEANLAAVPQLRRILYRPGPLAGRPLWLDDPAFRIERHVSQVEVPAPGDEQGVLRLAEELLTPPLDRSRPLWRIWFVTGLPEGRVAVVVAVHHAIADGLAAIQLVTRLLAARDDDRSGTGEPPAGGPGLTMRRPEWATVVRDNLGCRVATVRDLLTDRIGAVSRRLAERSARSALPAKGSALPAEGSAGTGGQTVGRPSGPLAGGQSASGSPVVRVAQRGAMLLRAVRQLRELPRQAPRTPLTVTLGSRRRLSPLYLDLAEVKQAAHRHGGTVNDVVLTLAAGGVRALVQSRGEPVDGVWLPVTVAVSSRPPDRAQEAGNHVGGVVVRLPLGEADPTARLSSIHAGRTQALREQSPMVGQAMQVAAARLGLVRWLTHHQRLIGLIESNLIGPPGPIQVLGATVTRLVPVGALAGNLGLSVLSLSYHGQLTVVVRADADHFPDLPVLLAAMESEWHALAAEAPAPDPADRA